MNWSLRLYIYDLTLFKKYINVLFASSLAEQQALPYTLFSTSGSSSLT